MRASDDLFSASSYTLIKIHPPRPKDFSHLGDVFPWMERPIKWLILHTGKWTVNVSVGSAVQQLPCENIRCPEVMWADIWLKYRNILYFFYLLIYFKIWEMTSPNSQSTHSWSCCSVYAASAFIWTDAHLGKAFPSFTPLLAWTNLSLISALTHIII